MIPDALGGKRQDIESTTQRFEHKPNPAFAQPGDKCQEPTPGSLLRHHNHPAQPWPQTDPQWVEPLLEPFQRGLRTLDLLVLFLVVDEIFV